MSHVISAAAGRVARHPDHGCGGAGRIGLANPVKPRSEVLPFARAIAQELADGPVWATRWTKLSVNQIVKDRVNRLLEASMAL